MDDQTPMASRFVMQQGRGCFSPPLPQPLPATDALGAHLPTTLIVTTTVHIYLPTQPEGVTPATEFIRALSIPLQDIQRLTIRPLKWLRFATFTVCGAKGDLSTTQGGKSADYENVTFNGLADTYYYTPDGPYHLIDLEAFNGSSQATPQRPGFRKDVCGHDNRCVITRAARAECDAAHIIPHSKGNNYITHVVRDHSSLYERPPLGSLEGSIDINTVQNGILLAKDLHDAHGNCRTVFLQTPNFAMEPTDVPWIKDGPISCTRTTLQYMEPPTRRGLIPPWDVQADWSDESVPPHILLDFTYGAAIVGHWKCDDLRDMLDRRHKDEFSHIPKYQKESTFYNENEPGTDKVRKTVSSDAKAAVLDAMDDVLCLSMLVRGPTPPWIVAERAKRERGNELRSQARSVEKVQQWLDSSRPS